MADAVETRIEPIVKPGELEQALAIREIVFIEEQAVPETLERDDDDATAFHVLAFQGGHAVGTGRLVKLDHGPEGESGRWGKIGRMAVLAASRKGGTGSMILLRLEQEARSFALEGILLHAQVHAQGFYERHGYAAFGPHFEEAGMPHVSMKKRLG